MCRFSEPSLPDAFPIYTPLSYVIAMKIYLLPSFSYTRANNLINCLNKLKELHRRYHIIRKDLKISLRYIDTLLCDKYVYIYL